MGDDPIPPPDTFPGLPRTNWLSHMLASLPVVSLSGSAMGSSPAASASSDQVTSSTAQTKTSMPPNETWTGRFLTTIGTGFLVAPPTASVTIAVKSEQINWGLIVALVAGCWIVGGLLLAAGLSWPRWRPSNERLARNLGIATSNVWVWAIILLLMAVGPALLVTLLSPRQNQQGTQSTVIGPAAPVSQAPPSKNYFPAEKTELGNLLSEMAGYLSNGGLAAVKEAAFYAKALPTKKETLAGIAQEILSNNDRVQAMSNSLNAIITNNPRYNQELKQIIPIEFSGPGSEHTPVREFQISMNTYRGDIDRVVDEYDGLDEKTRDWLLSIIRREGEFTKDRSEAFQTWINQCKDRIDKMRELLR
jgi:hypothetical protein